MSFVFTMIRRELLLLKHQWLKKIIFLIIFPMVLYLCLSMTLYNFISVPILDYLHWSVPGILILTSSIVCANYCLKEISLLKDKEGIYQIFLKSPMSLGNIIAGIFLISIFYSIVEFIIGAILLSLLNPGVFSISQGLLIFIQILSFVIFISSFSIFLGFLISNDGIIPYILMILFLFIAFIFGSLLPVELFPDQLSNYVQMLPMTGIVMNLQAILYMQTPFYFGMFMTIFVGVIFYLFSIVFVYKTLRKVS